MTINLFFSTSSLNLISCHSNEAPFKYCEKFEDMEGFLEIVMFESPGKSLVFKLRFVRLSLLSNRLSSTVFSSISMLAGSAAGVLPVLLRVLLLALLWLELLCAWVVPGFTLLLPVLFDESNTDEMLEEAGERGTEMSRLEMNSVSKGGGLESISTMEVCLAGCFGEFGARMAGDIGYLLEGIGAAGCVTTCACVGGCVQGVQGTTICKDGLV